MSSFSQINREDLLGEWLTIDTDSLYYKSDTIEFLQDPKCIYEEDICNFVEWAIKDSEFCMSNVFECSDPAFYDQYAAKEEFILYEENGVQKILILRDNSVVDRFEILLFEENEVQGRILKLKRNKTDYYIGS